MFSTFKKFAWKKAVPIILMVVILSISVFGPIAVSKVYALNEDSLKSIDCFSVTSAILPGGDSGINPPGCVAWLSFIALTAVSKLTTLAGFILEKSIEFSILQFKDFAGQGGLIDIGWTTIRDLANLIFIFLILWVAISTILGLHHGSAMGSVLRIVIAALLINFSLLITKAVVDVSNVFALHFYNLILGGGDGSVSGMLMHGLAMQTLFKVGTDISLGPVVLTWKIILVGIVGTIMLLVATWIFLAAAFLFLVRSIYLILLMIVSPIAFIAWVIPGMAGTTSDWWKKLFHQAFFAPIFMIIIYIAGRFIQSPGFTSLSGTNTIDSALNTVTSSTLATGANTSVWMASMGVFISFFIVIGLLIAALIVANKMGAVGAGTMMSWGNSIRNTGQSWVAGRTIGMGARWADEKLGHTYFGNTAMGKKFRELTTMPLKDAKWGGHYSAEERHKEDLELKTKRHEIALEKGEPITGKLISKITGYGKAKEIVKKATSEAGGFISSVTAPITEPFKSVGEKLGEWAGGEKGMVQIGDEIRKTEQELLAAKQSGDKEEITRLEHKTRDLGDEMRELINKMSPHAIANMDKNTLRNPYVMEYMKTAGINAIYQSKDYTEEEKREFLTAWLKHRKAISNNYQESTDRLEREERALRRLIATGGTIKDENGNNIVVTEDVMENELKKLAAQIRAEGGVIDLVKDARGYYDQVREMNVNALNMAHWADSDLFKQKGFVSVVRYGEIQNLRRSEDLTSGEKESMRLLKDYRGVEAADISDALDLDPPGQNEITAWENALNSLTDQEKQSYPKLVETYEKLIQAGKENAGLSENLRLADWESKKADELRGAVKSMSEEERQLYQHNFTNIQKAFHEWGETKMNDFEGGRSLTEMGYAKGALRTRPAYLDRMSQAILNTGQWRERDTEDKYPIIIHLLNSFELEQKALEQEKKINAGETLRPGEKDFRGFRMTEANKGTLKWLLTTPPDKQTFFNAYKGLSENPQEVQRFDDIREKATRILKTEMSNQKSAQNSSTSTQNSSQNNPLIQPASKYTPVPKRPKS